MDGVGVAVVEWMIKVIRAYVFAGLVFAIPFLLFGIQQVDPDTKGWNIGFRIIIIPGLCVFWPLFAVRWLRGKRTPTETTAHRLAATNTSKPRPS
ncbi:MAG: hypothetical protein AAGA83_26065 [Cyanobacteria bacterium P01_F01_bin.116]